MRHVSSIFFLAVIISSFSATAGSISGVVLDSITGKPVVGAKVTLFDVDLYDSTFTDSSGEFSVETPTPVMTRPRTIVRSVAKDKPSKVYDLRGRLVHRQDMRAPMSRDLASQLYINNGRKMLSPFNKGRRSYENNVSSTGALAKARASKFTLVFEKRSYVNDTVGLSSEVSDLEVLMDLPPYVDYRSVKMNFSPYVNGQNPNRGVFLPEDQIAERMRMVVPYTKVIRTFSTTHGLEVCGRVAHDYGLTTYIGAWIGRDDSANAVEVDSLIAMCRRGEVDTAIIGSEAMLRGDVTEGELINMIERFRDSVPNVPVTTADVYGELASRPDLIAVCDFVFGNFYPYWEGVKIDYAVANLHSSYESLLELYPDKKIMISEAGWPSEGAVYGQAEPSLENANFYFLNLISWSRAESVDVFYFEAFDEAWKTGEGTVGPHWGIFDTAGVMKDGMQPVFDGQTMENNWECDTLLDGPGDPEIAFTFVPEYGTRDNLEGKVSHVIPKDHGVVVYIKVGSRWWIKPTYASPVTRINVDGTWICDVTTGGYDTQATEYRAILTVAGYDPPSRMSLFSEDKIIAEISVVRTVPESE